MADRLARDPSTGTVSGDDGIISCVRAKKTLVLVAGGILLAGVGIVVGRYVVPSSSTGPTATSTSPTTPSTGRTSPPPAPSVPLITSGTAGQTSSFVVAGSGGAPMVFASLSGGSLWDYTYVGNSYSWKAAQITSSGVASTPVALLGPHGNPLVFYGGSGGSVWEYSYANSVWHPTEIASAGDESTPVAVVGSNSTVYVFYQAVGGSLQVDEQVSGIWKSSEIASQNVASAPSAVVQSDGSPVVFYEAAGGSMWDYTYENGTWQPDEIVTSGVASAPAAVLQAQGAPSVFYRSTDDALWDFSFISSGQWGSATVSFFPTVPTNSFYGQPSVIARPSATDAPAVFVQGPSNMLLTLWQDFSSGSWQASQVAKPESALATPGVALQANGGQSAFVFGPGGTLWDYWLGTNGTWQAEVIATTGVESG